MTNYTFNGTLEILQEPLVTVSSCYAMHEYVLSEIIMARIFLLVFALLFALFYILYQKERQK